MTTRPGTSSTASQVKRVTIIFVHGLNESITSPITRPTTRGSTDLDMVGALEGQHSKEQNKGMRCSAALLPPLHRVGR
uniref:Uncharacterized protein n=1 Tax=Oryza meridionalis TaxID=40149 RepID=A0A0E0D5A2_9ORYZ